MTALDQHLDVDRYVGRYVDQNHGWFYSNANSNVDEFQILFRLSCKLLPKCHHNPNLFASTNVTQIRVVMGITIPTVTQIRGGNLVVCWSTYGYNHCCRY